MAAWAAVVVAVIGTAVAAYSASEQAAAQEATNKYNRKVAGNQAIAAEQAAQVERESREEQHQRVLAAQRARLGGAGVLSNEGTPLLVQMESAEQAALDESRVTYQGKIGSRAYQDEAVLQGFYARTARRQGYVNAGASVLSGGAKAYGAYRAGTSTGPERAPANIAGDT